jgi:mannose-6-phosphate isomerase-like protein (cupin superfamily)
MNNLMDDWNEFLDKEESKNLDETLENFAFNQAVDPPPYMEDRIFAKINYLFSVTKIRSKLSFDNLPLLDRNSNYLDWNDLVKDLQPPAYYEEIHFQPFSTTKERELSVVWVKQFAEEEGHTDFEESLLLLEGSCICEMTDNDGKSYKVSMSVGDHLIIPMEHHHSMTVTTLEPIKFILQRKQLAA